MGNVDQEYDNVNLEAIGPLPPSIDLGAYVLRALRRDDAAAWYAYLSDPHVTRLTSYDVRSIDAVHRMIDAYIEGYTRRCSNRWAIADATSDRLVGTCGFYAWDPGTAVAELGYDLDRRSWGNGIMTRVVRAALQWGFGPLQADRVQATVMVGNLASVRVLEKCGFAYERWLPAHKICRGEPRDFWLFARHRQDVSSAVGALL